MTEAFICDAIRTPIGRFGGSLSAVRADDLATVPIKALMERNTSVDWGALDDVLYGCVNQAGEDNRNVARMALLLAGLPVEVPGATVNRLCGSGMQAVLSAMHAIRAGEGDVFIAGGVESMTRAPFVMLKPDEAFARGAPDVADTVLGWRFVNGRFPDHYTVSLGETAERVASRYGVTREAQDTFAAESQRRAGAAQQEGRFEAEIVAIRVEGRRETLVVDRDEHPRPDTTAAQLAKLRPVFRADGTVTAGNSSGLNDGEVSIPGSVVRRDSWRLRRFIT